VVAGAQGPPNWGRDSRRIAELLALARELERRLERLTPQPAPGPPS
jgi:hypothetical protein